MVSEVEEAVEPKIKGRILIVDDEAVVRDSLGKWFSSEGYQARPVASAREALESITHSEQDIARTVETARQFFAATKAE